MKIARLATVICLTMAGAAKASMVDATATYYIRVDPADPQSTVAYTVTFELLEFFRGQDYVDYDVTKATIVDNTNVWSWVKSNPLVDTFNGKWRVYNDDFLQPPLINGVATAITSGIDDLDFRVEGNTPPTSGPFNPTAALDYRFRRLAESDPDAEEDDEFVDPEIDLDP